MPVGSCDGVSLVTVGVKNAMILRGILSSSDCGVLVSGLGDKKSERGASSKKISLASLMASKSVSGPFSEGVLQLVDL
jgi:hypothetical protein